MAWEEENIEGAEFEEVGGTKSRLKLIIIIVAAVLVLGGGGFVVWKFFLQDDAAVAEEVAEASEPSEDMEAEDDVEDPGAAPETGFRVDLKEFTINLADEDEDRYMKASIVLEVSTMELRDAMKDEADAKLYMVKSRDLILDILRSKTASDMSDPANIRELRKEISTRLNSVVREGKVMEVYITDILVQ